MKLHVDLKENGYDILMEHGILYRLNDYIDLNRKVMIVTDSGVPEAYANIVREQCKKGYVHIIEQGEDSKDLAVFKEINEDLLAHKFSRKDCVVALGGGVVGDLAGYVAASYMRGIDFIQIPTTTLSQIDSSIGGKVAINLDEVKNIVGAFYQPKMVFIDPDTLQTLPRRHYINGLIEALKAGLIYDASLFALFEQGDIEKDLDTIIEKALYVKKSVVEQDEREQGLRKILNFGHTIGHAIESYYHLSEYLHGECVALGMLYFIDDVQLKQRVISVYERLGIRTHVDFDSEAVYQLLCRDKKADGDHVTIVHVPKVGTAQLIETPLHEVRTILKGTSA